MATHKHQQMQKSLKKKKKISGPPRTKVIQTENTGSGSSKRLQHQQVDNKRESNLGPAVHNKYFLIWELYSGNRASYYYIVAESC